MAHDDASQAIPRVEPPGTPFSPPVQKPKRKRRQRPGLNGCTQLGHRIRKRFREYVELAGRPTDPLALRHCQECAELAVAAEDMRGRLLNGADVHNACVRLTNAVAKAEAKLLGAKPAEPARKTLADVLREIAAEQPAAEVAVPTPPACAGETLAPGGTQTALDTKTRPGGFLDASEV